MNKEKDYYGIFGILPSAEDFVIRAVYKALAQRYHPDKYSGTKDKSDLRMVEINEAYAILSVPSKRKEYDELRGSNTQASDSYFNGPASDEVPPNFDPLEEDWMLASKYYPDLLQIEIRLSKISWRLAYSYRAYVLEAQKFKERKTIADSMMQQFLILYFGTNKEIIAFALKLINSGNKPAARTLNKTVRVLGSKIDVGRVIEQISSDFRLTEPLSGNKPCPYCGCLIYERAEYCMHCHKTIE
ncbi:MAG: DnaJ domain-containing protein [Simplicispira suum]|uniref:J domain-containing protein n=1 Tax=Simplicispira suum TaxID=2109915 RepID=UPI001C6D009D|nr:J domain-containing protein [Simplicispira suum]MBW7834528.1 DnaJ domain-containing protein [Simplicispira suum]